MLSGKWAAVAVVAAGLAVVMAAVAIETATVRKSAQRHGEGNGADERPRPFPVTLEAHIKAEMVLSIWVECRIPAADPLTVRGSPLTSAKRKYVS
jgi:hypothetical protein